MNIQERLNSLSKFKNEIDSAIDDLLRVKEIDEVITNNGSDDAAEILARDYCDVDIVSDTLSEAISTISNGLDDVVSSRISELCDDLNSI